MNSTYNTIEVCLHSIGLVYGIANINEILGAILLFLNAAQILVRLIIKIVDIINKKSSPDELTETLEGATEFVEELIEENKKGDEEQNEQDTEQR